MRFHKSDFSVMLSLAFGLLCSSCAHPGPFPQKDSEWSAKLGQLKIKVSQTFDEINDLATGTVTVFRNGPEISERVYRRHANGGIAGIAKLEPQPFSDTYAVRIEGDERTTDLLTHEDGRQLEFDAYSSWKLTDSLILSLADQGYALIDMKEFKFVKQDSDSEAASRLLPEGIQYDLGKLNGKFYVIPNDEKSDFIEEAKILLRDGKCAEIDPLSGQIKPVQLQPKEIAAATLTERLF